MLTASSNHCFFARHSGKESECLVEHLLDPAQDFIKFNKNNGSAMLAQTTWSSPKRKWSLLNFGQVSADSRMMN